MQTMQKGRELTVALNTLYPFPEDLGVEKCNSTPKEDWSGDPAIYFYITVADEVAENAQFGEIARRIEKYILDKIDPMERFGRFAYFYYHTRSEQNMLQDPHFE